ncbi:hypothetical protein QR680_002330 [Steinernema hermaphroditum]|uniref:Saposin B-type domain-containing protein n=1 Tax=Steinernema hermaphroditum TaxID=289476 RepID=A0AA39LHX6_9BILA|nr:hypothetical protein QR680_002330 [Steinernema hermaphroditum]
MTTRFRVYLFAALIVSLVAVDALTPDEECEMCQNTLQTVYAHFSAKVPSKRVVMRQLEHQCKRQPTYKRRCLLLIRPNIDMIFSEMKNSGFKPIWCCERMKECSKNQSPIVDTASSLELTS